MKLLEVGCFLMLSERDYSVTFVTHNLSHFLFQLLTEAFNWEETVEEWWWRVADVDDFDNIGMSRVVEGPAGRVQIVLCSECQMGPFGFQREGENDVWLCCSKLIQQDKCYADNESDFKLPEGTSIEQLR